MEKDARTQHENMTEDEHDSRLQTTTEVIAENFEDFNLNQDLLRGVFGYGLTRPTVIQQKSILALIQNRDIIAQAQSGSGKTVAYLIGTLHNIDVEILKIQALIIVPTRELAEAVNYTVQTIGKHMNVKSCLCIGGQSIEKLKKDLQEGVHIVVGTPGRMVDTMKRGLLVTSLLKTLILDEADELLSRGFVEEVNDIVKMIPSDCQIALFSATMPPEIIKMTEGIMRDPAKILVENEDLTLMGIKQFFIQCATDDVKFDNMIEIFACMEVVQCMIYVNTREKAEQLAQKMKDKGFECSCVHGKMAPDQRNNIVSEFKSGSFRILITTDLLARDIDVHPVGLVVNFELPMRKEEYIRRVGRTCRGRIGIAINLISKLEAKHLMEIERHYSTQITKLSEDLSELKNY